MDSDDWSVDDENYEDDEFYDEFDDEYDTLTIEKGCNTEGHKVRRPRRRVTFNCTDLCRKISGFLPKKSSTRLIPVKMTASEEIQTRTESVENIPQCHLCCEICFIYLNFTTTFILTATYIAIQQKIINDEQILYILVLAQSVATAIQDIIETLNLDELLPTKVISNIFPSIKRVSAALGTLDSYTGQCGLTEDELNFISIVSTGLWIIISSIVGIQKIGCVGKMQLDLGCTILYLIISFLKQTAMFGVICYTTYVVKSGLLLDISAEHEVELTIALSIFVSIIITIINRCYGCI